MSIRYISLELISYPGIHSQEARIPNCFILENSERNCRDFESILVTIAELQCSVVSCIYKFGGSIDCGVDIATEMLYE